MHAGRKPFAADDAARSTASRTRRCRPRAPRASRSATAIACRLRRARARPRPRAHGPIVRLHTLTRSIGRTNRCASASSRAMRPDPTMTRCRASARASRLAAYAEAPAVRHAVISSPSNNASAVPLRGIEQRVDRADRALPATRIAGKHRHELDADAPARCATPASAAATPSARRAPRSDDARAAAPRRRRGASRRARRASAARAGARGSRRRRSIASSRARGSTGAPAVRRVSSDSDSSAALPPAAAVLTVSVRSTTRRIQSPSPLRPEATMGTIAPRRRGELRAHAARPIRVDVQQHGIDRRQDRACRSSTTLAPPRWSRAASAHRLAQHQHPVAERAHRLRLRDQRALVPRHAQDGAARVEFERVRFAGRAGQRDRRPCGIGAAACAPGAAGRAVRRPSGPVPESRWPPNGCTPTTAPTMLRLT